jgi:hypothetical protein
MSKTFEIGESLKLPRELVGNFSISQDWLQFTGIDSNVLSVKMKSIQVVLLKKGYNWDDAIREPEKESSIDYDKYGWFHGMLFGKIPRMMRNKYYDKPSVELFLDGDHSWRITTSCYVVAKNLSEEIMVALEKSGVRNVELRSGLGRLPM